MYSYLAHEGPQEQGHFEGMVVKVDSVLNGFAYPAFCREMSAGIMKILLPISYSLALARCALNFCGQLE